jgi:hypothetical protein
MKLNDRSFEHAKQLIRGGDCVLDERDAWSEHQPSAEDENEFIEQHAEKTKARYRFPYGDFEKVHRCALLAAEARAGQRHYLDIELAVAHLHGMLDALA